MMNQHKRLLFFVGVGLYISVITFFGQPEAHAWRDILAMREVGTIWDTLSWNPQNERRYFFPVAILCHHQGPLQFLALNFYYRLVGDILPLDPTTTQIPHALMTFLCAVFIYAIGTRIMSEQFGYLSVIMFLCAPWLPMADRRPWLFVMFGCVFESGIIFSYVESLQSSCGARRLARIAPPLLLTGYLLGGGFDWPAFLFILAIFLGSQGQLRNALRNPYNLFPASVLLLYAGLLALQQRVEAFSACSKNLLVYPFQRVLMPRLPETHTPVDNLVTFGGHTLGWLFVIAIGGVLLTFRTWRSGQFSAQQKNFFLVMSIWLLFFSFPLLKFGVNVSFNDQNLGDYLPYGYVLGLPLAFLAARALLACRTLIRILCIVGFVGWQWSVIIQDHDTFAYPDDDRRAIAGAAFVLDNRPDLLAPGKRTLLIGDIPRSIGNYARGQNLVLSLGANAPAIFQNVSPEHPVGGVVSEFFQIYQGEHTLPIDWLILTPDLLEVGPGKQSAGFYRQIVHDPQINWIARLQDRNGRELWIGEVRPGGTPLDHAPIYEVEPFAQRYQQEYNHIRFLKRNVRYILHY
jgi:hypothetical protein